MIYAKNLFGSPYNNNIVNSKFFINGNPVRNYEMFTHIKMLKLQNNYYSNFK